MFFLLELNPKRLGTSELTDWISWISSRALVGWPKLLANEKSFGVC